MLVVISGACLISACGMTSAAPPLTICGQTLYSGANGPVVTDATTQARVEGLLTADNAVFIRLAPGCDVGASITIEPAASGTVVAKATARQGGLIAVEIRPSSRGTVTVTRADRTTSVVTISPT